VEEKAKKQERQSFEPIHEASARPKNVKDIRDELNMLKSSSQATEYCPE
tara:strand:+ start:528 stop:674 length:147 start_codon:yes stop_codon:yes gene_type:complete